MDDLLSRGPARLLQIAHLTQRPPGLHPVAGLLVNLAQRSLEVRLAGGKLALRKAPVVVPGAMDHGDLHLASALPLSDAPHDAARCLNRRPCHYFALTTRRHARLKVLRAFALRCRSRSSIRPPARFSGPLLRRSLSYLSFVAEVSSETCIPPSKSFVP